MEATLQDLDLDAVLAQMPTALVVLEVGSGRVVYANEPARAMPFAYTDDPAWTVVDVHGERVDPDSLPHRAAVRGEACHRRLLRFDRGAEQHSLLFHCHKLENALCVLTFDDVTELDDVQRQLREALQARDELVSMAAHELRSPLGALQLIAERIARKATDLAPDELMKIADAALRQTRRLNVLVGNMLDVSRMRAGKFELDLERASLGEIVREACEPLVEQAASSQIKLSLTIDVEAVAQWDRVRMEQVVTNLVTNAVKYGGNTPVEVILRPAGEGEVELCVSDQGPGIPPDEQARIFELYVRASRRHSAQSLGLGLYIVREIVQAHGGRLELKSHPGSTTFSIFLPLR